jgi:uncharacterized protein (DUF924 family)
MEWIIAPVGLDNIVKTRFGFLVLKVRHNEDHWTSEPESSLDLIVLLDQISRNIFRGSPDAFSADEKARDISTKAGTRY